jgi:ADP-ribose pyrophosphatase YjhB (NUDIX family)
MFTIVNLFIGNPEEGKILAVKRCQEDKALGGMWALPGGTVEPGETYLDTAHRELREEANLHVTSISTRPVLDSILKLADTEARILVFTASVKDLNNAQPNSDDIEKVAWIKPKMLIESLRAHNYPDTEIETLKSYLLTKGFLSLRTNTTILYR